MKRLIDIILSFTAILFCLPLWIVIAGVIYVEDRRPIFFKQLRAGKYSKPFTIYKFRTFKENNIHPLELGVIKGHHLLMTRVGFYLRRFKLDETPQFINILKGDMTFVGPRPCLLETAATLNENEKLRFKILPGLTGWAEVNGHLELSKKEQFALDAWYAKNQSVILDILIVIKTIGVILFGSKRNEIALQKAQELK